MSRQWKPGDVAMLTDCGGLANAIFRTEDGWVDAEGDHRPVLTDSKVSAEGRALVVIDPDSPQDQRRLLDYLRNSGAFRGVVSQDVALDCIGDALRSLVSPPKPDEPRGLGAVVEDSNGDLWVRMSPRIADFDWFNAADHSRTRAYRNIAAVKVLSEGVTP